MRESKDLGLSLFKKETYWGEGGTNRSPFKLRSVGCFCLFGLVQDSRKLKKKLDFCSPFEDQKPLAWELKCAAKVLEH